MSYVLNGLGVVSVTAQARQALHPTTGCVTRARSLVARASCATARVGCEDAQKPICPAEATPLPAEDAASTGPSAPPSKAVLTSLVGRPVKSAASASASTAKIPVPAAEAAPIEESLPPMTTAPPDEGIPVWIWIAGGAAVLGTGAFIYSRRRHA